MIDLRNFWPKSLAEEVIEVFAAVKELKKIGHNLEDDYYFLRIVDLCEAFKKELFRRGMLFVATDKQRIFEELREDGEQVERCTVLTEFSVIHGRQSLPLGTSFGSARHHDDKALAIAQTAAFKAFLKRVSMTYGQEDDPETDREVLGARESVRIASYQKRAWLAAVRDSGRTPVAISAELSEIMGFPIDCEQIPDLPRKDFDVAVRWLLNAGELKKPQPIVTKVPPGPCSAEEAVSKKSPRFSCRTVEAQPRTSLTGLGRRWQPASRQAPGKKD